MLLERFTILNRSKLLANLVSERLTQIRLLRPARYRQFTQEDTHGDIILLEFEGHTTLAFKSLIERRTLIVNKHIDCDYYWDQYGIYTSAHEKVISLVRPTQNEEVGFRILGIYFLFENRYPYSHNPKGLQIECENGQFLHLTLEFGNTPEEVLLQWSETCWTQGKQDCQKVSIDQHEPETDLGVIENWVRKPPKEGKFSLFQPDIDYFKRKLIPLPNDPLPSIGSLASLKTLRDDVINAKMDILDIQLCETSEGDIFLVPPIELAEGPPYFAPDWLNYLIQKLEEERKKPGILP